MDRAGLFLAKIPINRGKLLEPLLGRCFSTSGAACLYALAQVFGEKTIFVNNKQKYQVFYFSF